MSPETRQRGPVKTPAENAAAAKLQVPSQGTTANRQAANRRAVQVRGVVEVDLSRHVDRIGCVYADARAAIHRGLCTLPAGVAVRVRLGRAQWLDDGVLDLLAECLLDAGSVEIVGSDDRGPAYVVPRLRERLEGVL